MSANAILRILREAILLTLLLSAGPMVVGIVVAFISSLFQTTTQLQDRTLSDVPKLVFVYLTIGILGHWMIIQTVAFTRILLESIVSVR